MVRITLANLLVVFAALVPCPVAIAQSFEVLESTALKVSDDGSVMVGVNDNDDPVRYEDGYLTFFALPPGAISGEVYVVDVRVMVRSFSGNDLGHWAGELSGNLQRSTHSNSGIQWHSRKRQHSYCHGPVVRGERCRRHKRQRHGVQLFP